MLQYELGVTKSLLPYPTDPEVSDECGRSAHDRGMFSSAARAHSALGTDAIERHVAVGVTEPEVARRHPTRGRCKTCRPNGLAIERVDCSCLATTTCAAAGDHSFTSPGGASDHARSVRFHPGHDPA